MDEARTVIVLALFVGAILAWEWSKSCIPPEPTLTTDECAQVCGTPHEEPSAGEPIGRR